MTPERWAKISETYHAASEMDISERDLFLVRECAGDENLRKEVESLLAADHEAGDFISSPIVGTFASDILETGSPAPDEMFGHYRIISKIGSGGMGEIFLAIDTKLGREVAIKTLSSAFQGETKFIKRFQTEARAVATLNHPNVATIFSVDEHNGSPFIAMEYLHGETVDKLIPESGVEVGTFIDWFAPIADGIAHAHAKGVVHRDIKPGNLMITHDGTPKILDFGLAHFQPKPDDLESKSNITQEGQIIGTPAYMSPEQAEGKDVDQRSDIFSLGIVMYEAITGRPPFTGDSYAETVSNLLKTEPQPISAVRPGIPEIITAVVHKCLRKNAAHRYQKMDEVCDALTVLSIRERSSSSFESLQRMLFPEQRQGSAKWLGIAAVSVMVGAFLGWYYFSSASAKSAINFADLSFKKVTQSNNVGYTQITPDGRSVAFAVTEPDKSMSLWIRRADDPHALELVPQQPVNFWGGLAISEDGGQVFYLIADRSATHGSLNRVSSLGGSSRKLIDKANDVGGLSPDGQRILFVRYGETNQILSANTLNGGAEQLVRAAPPGPTTFRDPQYSPDGKSVYYVKYERIGGVENWSLQTLSLDSGNETELLRQRERISEIAVIRDGRGLLVTAIDPVSNLQQIFQVSLRDGQKVRVTNDLFYYSGISIDRDGRNIVSTQVNDENRIWIGDAPELSNMRLLTPDQNAYKNVDWTPDGRIVFDASVNNRAHIWIADADGKKLQQLTGSETDDSEPRISGDGSYIVFTSKRSNLRQVWRMNIDGSNQVLLANVEGATEAPRFHPDGQTVIFSWLRDASCVLATVPVQGGDVVEMTEYGKVPLFTSFYWAMSPDRKNVAYTILDERAPQDKIAVRPSSAAEPSKILDIVPSLIFKWTPDGKSILYRERRFGYQPDTTVRKVDIESGESKTMFSASPEWVLDMAFSGDGKRVAIVRGKGTSNAVMLSVLPGK